MSRLNDRDDFFDLLRAPGLGGADRQSYSEVVIAPIPKSHGLEGLKAPLIAGLVLLIASAAVASLLRHDLDYPAVLFLNRFAHRSMLLDYTLYAATKLALLQGVVVVAGIWLVWFDAPDLESRARVAAGVIAAAFAGMVSRGLQLALPTHPRPIHDGALSFTVPYGVDPTSLNHWDSFPSDHASLLFGIATIVAVIRPRIGLALFAWALIVNLGRVYTGFHFLSDIIGGAGLGVVIVCLSQLSVLRNRCRFIARWATERPGLFYAAAFIATYSTATMFDDVRAIGKGLAMLRH